MGLLDLMYPKTCLTCTKVGEYLCESCLKRVEKISPFCVVCKKPSIDGFIHTSCETPQGMSRLISLWKYQGVVKTSIIKLKYKFAYDIAEELIDKFLSSFEVEVLPKNAILVPIPLHPKRERWRGFNQAEKLGKILAGKMGWDFLSDFLIRIKYTNPQTTLKKKEREQNVVGVFSLNSYYSSFTIRNSTKSIPLILFDDVYTTGSTMKEAVKTIKRKNKNLDVIAMTVCC